MRLWTSATTLAHQIHGHTSFVAWRRVIVVGALAGFVVAVMAREQSIDLTRGESVSVTLDMSAVARAVLLHAATLVGVVVVIVADVFTGPLLADTQSGEAYRSIIVQPFRRSTYRSLLTMMVVLVSWTVAFVTAVIGTWAWSSARIGPTSLNLGHGLTMAHVAVAGVAVALWCVTATAVSAWRNGDMGSSIPFLGGPVIVLLMLQPILPMSLRLLVPTAWIGYALQLPQVWSGSQYVWTSGADAGSQVPALLLVVGAFVAACVIAWRAEVGGGKRARL